LPSRKNTDVRKRTEIVRKNRNCGGDALCQERKEGGAAKPGRPSNIEGRYQYARNRSLEEAKKKPATGRETANLPAGREKKPRGKNAHPEFGGETLRKKKKSSGENKPARRSKDTLPQKRGTKA